MDARTGGGYHGIFPDSSRDPDLDGFDGLLDECDSRRSSMDAKFAGSGSHRHEVDEELDDIERNSESPCTLQEFLEEGHAALQQVLAEQHERAMEVAGLQEEELAFLRKDNEQLREELRKAGLPVPEPMEGPWCEGIKAARSLSKQSGKQNGHASASPEVKEQAREKVSPVPPPPVPVWKPAPVPMMRPDQLNVDQTATEKLPGCIVEEFFSVDDLPNKAKLGSAGAGEKVIDLEEEEPPSGGALAAAPSPAPAAEGQREPVADAPAGFTSLSVNPPALANSNAPEGGNQISPGKGVMFEAPALLDEGGQAEPVAKDDNRGTSQPYQEMSVKCTYCGNIFMADARFCRRCGTPRPEADSMRQGQSPERTEASQMRRSHTNPFYRDASTMSFGATLSGGPSSRPKNSHHATRGTHQGRPSRASTSRVSSVDRKDQQKERFEVLPMWKSKRDGSSKIHCPKLKKPMQMGGARHNSLLRRVTHKSMEPDDVKKIQAANSWRSRFCRLPIVHPNSPRRGTWDMMSLVLVLYDMAYIPLQFFEPPETAFGEGMIWTTRMFWTIDMPLSFLTGYVTADGFIIMKPSKIIPRYLKSWFLLDALIVSTDWLEVVMSAGGSLGFARMGKASRVFRIVRMLRLLRLARMREVLALITERINSEKVVIIADILKIMIIIVATAHFIACMWYGVAMAQAEDQSWVGVSGYARKTMGAKYTMSLHWSIAQFAGGMDEITPESTGERVFAICMFILAFIMASVFVSSITSSMTQLNIIGSHQSQQLSTLRRYLHQNGISNKLAMRVQRNAQHAVSEQQRTLPENSVGLLAMVSEPLRVEIHLEMYSPVFTVHPWFRSYIEECPQVMRKVCHSATSMMTLSSGDVIFSAGEIPSSPKMYFVCVGLLVYHIGHKEQELWEGMWIAEASLWTHWMHRGMFMATTDCRLCVLDAKRFQHIVDQFEHSEFDPTSYAAEFIAGLNAMEDPTDLIIDTDVISRSVSEIQDKKIGVHRSWWMDTPCGPYIVKLRRYIRHRLRKEDARRRSMSRLRATHSGVGEDSDEEFASGSRSFQAMTYQEDMDDPEVKAKHNAKVNSKHVAIAEEEEGSKTTQ